MTVTRSQIDALRIALVCAAMAAISAAALGQSDQKVGQSGVDDASAQSRNWPAYGGPTGETHYSALTQIDVANVARLGLAFAIDLGNDAHGATVPIAVDGVIYATVGQSRVHAIDVRQGKLLWVYDPDVANSAGRTLRYGFGPRGLAYARGRVFVGTMDGWLLALDARNGELAWRVKTTQPDDDRYITGAPRVAGDLVVIGHGGADWGPVRGYVTAYDIRTGGQRWRFYTVPGDPTAGFESEAMRAAAKTWSGEWWRLGGGGTVWNAMTYDAEQGLLYLGTGNGAPHNAKIRSPKGGDNLYLCSIVAVDASTGEYRWHYQVNPGESWDYNAAMDIAMATVQIDGKARKVLLHAPKNGFFYVLDRVTGKLISAGKFADNVTWASHIDPVSGRPVENPSARYDTPQTVWPGTMGAHSWAPMSVSEKTGLAYIPTIEMPGYFDDTSLDRKQWQFTRGQINLGYVLPTGAAPKDAGTSYLQAYDPVRQRRVWQVPAPGAWPGGTLTTAGNLVFFGRPDGRFDAYAAQSGQLLWSYQTGLGISGAPISFAVDGKQYIAVVAGWGGAGAGYFGTLSPFGWQARAKHHHLYVFALDAHAPSPVQASPQETKVIATDSMVLDDSKVARGGQVFVRTCAACHGAGAVAAGYAPDLRASPLVLDAGAFRAVLRDGALLARGMPIYPEFNDVQLDELRHFIRAQARKP